MPITIKPTQLKYKDPSTSQYVSVVAAAEGGSSNVDIQINETSILSNGIANIPEASSETYGVLKTGYSTSGLQKDVGGYLKIYPATSDNIKTGTEAYRPIVPYHQHESVFYGLAKVAGADMSSSSNEVGVYTDTVKTAIQSMLAVPSSNNPIFTGTFSQNRKSNTTVGTNSFSSGDNCEASAEDSHAEGRYTIASGHYSHAEGNYTTASGMASHAAGTVTVANHASQYTFGEYNVEDSSSASALTRGNYIEIVGNGTASNAKSNARTLDWNGNEYLNGYLYVGCNADSSGGTRIPHDIQINGTSIVLNGVANIPIADGVVGVVKVRENTDGLKIDSSNNLQIAGPTENQIKSGATNYRPLTPYLQHTATFYGLAKAAGDSTQSSSSNAVGVYTDNAKTAIQNMLNVLSATDPVITGSISQARLANSTIGYNSIALGENCQASGSHSLAFGYQCSATGPSAHAEGYLTSASGLYSVSMGLSTVSMYQTETVIGRYNNISRFQDMTSWESGVSYSEGDKVWWSPYILICKEDHTSSGTEPPESLWAQDLGTLFVVGNGMTGATRSNALTLTHEGKLLIADYLYVGANANGEGGYRVPHDIQVNGTSIVNNGIANILLPTKVSDLTNDSGFLTSVPTMTGATASANGTSGLVPAPTSGDIYKFLAGDGTYRSGGLPMVILSYGNSTWSDFIEAYNNNVIVYCRASSNANPKTGSQTRMAFMAYVNNETTPTNVEFQYYRSMSSHSGTQMGDQVYVYKLDKTSGWSVTVREAGLKEIEFDASTGLTATWSGNKLTITTV